MIKRTLVISDTPSRLSVESAQLVIHRSGHETSRVPIEDIGVLLVDQTATTYTHAVFTRLAEAGAVVILCGERHLPVAVVWPMESNDLTGRRIRQQAAASLPLRKRLWKQIVRRKVRLQALNLPEDHPVRKRLLQMVTEVRSGDASNIEGQAARFYWPALLGEAFRRDAEGGDPPNGLLNYGYTLMRSLVGRAIVAAGLHPALGLQHRHRNNSFALADDLMEPLRPLVDATVARIWDAGRGEGFVNRQVKETLLNLMVHRISVGAPGDEKGPLMVQFQRVCTSLVRCYESESSAGAATTRTKIRLELPFYSTKSAQFDEADDTGELP